MFEKFTDAITRRVGSTTSIILHSIFFVGVFSLLLVDVPLDTILLMLTTLVSLEAIYLALFIQRSVNINTATLEEVGEDIDQIEENIDEISEDVEEISEDIEGIEKDIDVISEEVEDLGEDLEDVGKDLDGIEKEIKEIGDDIEEVSDEVEDLGKDVDVISEHTERGDSVDGEAQSRLERDMAEVKVMLADVLDRLRQSK
jgi:uncharacterized protein YoxC